MVILSNNDVFEVHLNSLLADYDRDTLTNLYQPIIGYEALAVYFTLWSESSVQKVLSFSTTEQLLIRMKMPVGHFVDARKLLEAVGLLKTRLERTPQANIYHYELFAPKTPKGFFADTLLYGMMIQALGETNSNRIKRIYELTNKEEGEDISSSFNDVFHPDYENPAFLKAASAKSNVMGRNKSKIAVEFSYEKFFVELAKVSQINENFISKKEMKELARLASLYGVEEESVATIVANNYLPEKEKGERLDLESINKDLQNETNYTFINRRIRKEKSSGVSSDTQIARKINIFENTPPKQILSLLQNGTKAAPSDLRIIDTLSRDYRLANGPINVIIDFVLAMNKNVLSKAYAEKLAASFNREGIETTLDAMNYCNEVLNKNKKNKSVSKAKVNEEIVKKEEKVTEISEEQWDKLFNEEKDEGNNGETDGELPF